MKLLELRHNILGHAAAGLDPESLVEGDGCYVNAKGKRSAALRAG